MSASGDDSVGTQTDKTEKAADSVDETVEGCSAEMSGATQTSTGNDSQGNNCEKAATVHSQSTAPTEPVRKPGRERSRSRSPQPHSPESSGTASNKGKGTLPIVDESSSSSSSVSPPSSSDNDAVIAMDSDSDATLDMMDAALPQFELGD